MNISTLTLSSVCTSSPVCSLNSSNLVTPALFTKILTLYLSIAYRIGRLVSLRSQWMSVAVGIVFWRARSLLGLRPWRMRG